MTRAEIMAAVERLEKAQQAYSDQVLESGQAEGNHLMADYDRLTAVWALRLMAAAKQEFDWFGAAELFHLADELAEGLGEAGRNV